MVSPPGLSCSNPSFYPHRGKLRGAFHDGECRWHRKRCTVPSVRYRLRCGFRVARTGTLERIARVHARPKGAADSSKGLSLAACDKGT